MRISPRRLIVFLGVVGSVSALLHGYAWLRLFRDPAWGAPWELLGGVALAVLGVLVPAAILSARTVRPSIATPLAWLGYSWLGTIFYLDVLLLPIDLARVLLAAVDPDGAPFLGARWVAATATVGALSLVAAGIARVRRGPVLREVDVPIEGLPAALEGFRIVQLSDVHVGPTIDRAFVERLVARTNALAPDVIAITGDLVDGSVAALARGVAPLSELRARHGVFFVTGNHEYFSGADAWARHVATLGARVLRNEHDVIDHDGAALVVAGIDDVIAPHFGDRSDVELALEGAPEGVPVVLLAHQPRSIDAAARAGVALQLSGHTHGGQMQPFGLLVKLEQPFLSGLHRVARTWLWVSEGTGYWGPPLRVGSRSEISVVRLVAAR
ncbi:metallophosphoesterase [Sandaracinus amylolyticus]|uniref:metallophosphoesterase n=1 Tax=Sandaracinus amylolyticus TaxID=927083 RepID=UPI00069F46A0|nr:metallophosphoesterase [Sandaracinus amylolyticus]